MTKTHKRKCSFTNRTLQNILRAVSSIDGFREHYEEITGQGREIKLRHREFRIEAQTRVQLAQNLTVLKECEERLQRRRNEVVRSFEPKVEGNQVLVAKEKMPELQSEWERVLDETVEVELLPIDVAGLHGGENAMPISMFSYLMGLASEESLSRRFSQKTEHIAVARGDTERLLISLGDFDGRAGEILSATPNGPVARQVIVPWTFGASTIEDLAYNYYVLYRTVGEVRATLRQLVEAPNEAGAVSTEELTQRRRQWLSETLSLSLIPLNTGDLNLEENQIPIATLSALEPVFGLCVAAD